MFPICRLRVFGGLIGLFALTGPALADAPPQPTERGGTFNILFENDIFYNTDHDYTNGVALAYTTPPNRNLDWAVRLARDLPFFAQTVEVRTSYAIGQNIYTPDDITLTNPPLTARPYAGYLYGAIGLIDDTGSRLDQIQVQLGVVGPASLAQESQTWVHGIIKDRHPNGWHYQLRDEPALLILYDRTVKALPRFTVLGFSADIEPHYGAAIGNVYDYASLGAMARIGFNMAEDYGPPRIEPSLPGSNYFESNGGIGAYIFAGVDGRAIAHNIFLDGNSFATSRSVQRLPLVGEAELGAALTVNGVRLAFTHVFRTREYHTQKATDQFGSVSLTFRF
jgi:hypothetical protein